MKRAHAMVVASTLIIEGCALDAGGGTTTTSVESAETVEVTEVELRPDGHHIVTQRQLTRAQVEAMRNINQTASSGSGLGQATLALTDTTSSCIGSDNWFYDSDTYPYGRLLCLRGTGTANLADFGRGCGQGGCLIGGWSGAVRRVWPASVSGYGGSLGNLSGEFYSACSGSGWSAGNSAFFTNSCEDSATYVRCQ